jgi:hypothetical protein
MSVFQRPDYAKKYRKSATIVADPGAFQDRTRARGSDVDVFVKDRVEVGAHNEVRLGARPGTLRDHISGTIDSYVLESERLQRLPERLCPARLLERRRRNLTQPDLVFEHLRLAALDAIDRGRDRWLLNQAPADFHRRFLRRTRSALSSVVRKRQGERYHYSEHGDGIVAILIGCWLMAAD